MQIQIQKNGEYFTADYDMGTQTYVITGPATPSYSPYTEQVEDISIGLEDWGGNSTSITIDEVFNQLVLTCNLEDLETVVDSPLEEETLTSPYDKKVLWATEYVSSGEGESALNGCFDMIETGSTRYDGATSFEHYLRLKKSNIWKLNGDKYVDTSYDQAYIMKRARAGSCLAFLAGMGNIERVANKQDNAVKNDIKLTDYLVISVNGNMINKDVEESESILQPNTYHRWPSDNVINNAQPIAEYVGNLTSTHLSPVDSQTTNYLVIKAEFTMVPAANHAMVSPGTFWPLFNFPPEILGYTENEPIYSTEPKAGVAYDYGTLKQQIRQDRGGLWDKLWHRTRPISDNTDGAYYFVKFYDNNGMTERTAVGAQNESIYPYNSKWDRMKYLKYSYSSYGDETDMLHKLNILCCRLSVGDKYCVEIFHNNAPSTFEWRRLEDCPVVTYQGQKIIKNFIYIGPNPKIDDNIIDMSKSWKIANNINYKMNLEGEGMAIPVKYSDQLSGPVKFEILGPVNSMWAEIVREHPSFWKHTAWHTDSYGVLANTECILVKDFTIEVQSDNGLNESIEEERDLIYQTAENPIYISKKDDIEFDICTQLTAEEAKEKGVNTLPKKNNAFVGDEAVRSLYNVNTANSGKAEELYLTDYYREYCEPQTSVETTLQGLKHWTIRPEWPETGKSWTTGLEYDVKRVKTKIMTKTVEQI